MTPTLSSSARSVTIARSPSSSGGPLPQLLVLPHRIRQLQRADVIGRVALRPGRALAVHRIPRFFWLGRARERHGGFDTSLATPRLARQHGLAAAIHAFRAEAHAVPSGDDLGDLHASRDGVVHHHRPQELSDWDRYTAPGPGSSVPTTAEMNAAVRIPGAMGSPKEVDAAHSAS